MHYRRSLEQAYIKDELPHPIGGAACSFALSVAALASVATPKGCSVSITDAFARAGDAASANAAAVAAVCRGARSGVAALEVGA